MQDNPFADLIPAGGAQSAPQAPARIYGAPKRIDPAEQQRLALAERTAVRQDEASARADAAAERQTRLAEATLQNQTRLTEAEGKTTAFYNRALGADRDFEATQAATNPRGMLGQIAADILPTGLVNNYTGADRQKAEQAKRDFIAASLRYESGAAISPAEFEKQDTTFFPQPGDTPEVIQQKAAARQRIIESFSVGAGRGSAQVDALRGDQPKRSNVSEDGLSAIVNAAQGPAVPDEIQEDGSVIRNGERVYPTDAQTNGDAFQAAYRAKFGKPLGLVVSVEGGSKSPEAAQRESAMGNVDAFVRGAADTVTLGLSDEIAAAGNTVFGGGTMRQNLRNERATNAMDERINPWARLGGQVAGGFVLPTGGASTAAELGRIGALYGAGYGFGSADGDLRSRVEGAGTGLIAGGAAGYGLGALGNLAASRLGGRTPPTGRGGVNQDVVAAADRQGVELVRPDVQASKRGIYGFLETLPFAGSRVRSDLQRGTSQIETRAGELGGGMPVPRDTAGDTIRDAGERYIDRSRTVVNRLYDRAANLAGNAQVTARGALSTLDTHIAQLGQTPNSNRTKLDILGQIRSDLVDDAGNLRPLSIQAIRDIRTAARDELSTKGLRYSDTERRVMDAIDSASTDIRSQLQGSALRAYDRADRAYRERADLVDNVIETFIGKDRTSQRSSEKIMSSVEAASAPGATGNAVALGRMMSRLEPQERQQVASTIAAQLGRRGADGDNAFSPNLFFSQAQKFSEASRVAIFGAQGARDIADLARISEARASTLSMLNNSRSGQANNWLQTLKSVLGAGAGAGAGAAIGAGATGGAGAAGAVMVGGYLTARALGNRRVVSALAQAARATTPPAQQRVVAYLGQIASRQPQIANDILPVKRMLEASISKAAAEESPNENVQD